MSFLTLEDVNTALFSNQGFWWHTIDTSVIDPDGTAEYENIKMDFCTITKTKNSGNYYYTIYVDNPYFTGGYSALTKDGDLCLGYQHSGNLIKLNEQYPSEVPIKLMLYMGINNITGGQGGFMGRYLVNSTFDLTLKELNQPQTIRHNSWNRGGTSYSETEILTEGYTEIKDWNNRSCGFVLVNLVKSDFKFNCTQQLIVGKVNKVQLGTDSEYLPNGDMIGEYTPSIRVLYNDETLPVTYDNTLNDYTFDLDLTEETTEHKIHLKVLIDSNEVLNSTSTDVTLSSSFETINTLDKLSHLFNVGGVGRLGSDLTLTDDLTVTKDVYIVGNEHTINMDSHKIMVPSDKIFKAEQTTFNNGENTIQQNEASKVELINCTFTDCTGLGSVIDCQIDVTSLDNPTDFTTILNKCTLNNNDMCILHGGNLTVTDSTINGKISDDKYPYFLYQTDGEAHITGTIFNLTHNTPITTDIGYNSCIFTIGEQATINYGDHKEYSQNNILGFLENSRNISIINVTYYYPPIEDYVTLSSNNGYCHSVSSVDFVFKTNVQLTRGE